MESGECSFAHVVWTLASAARSALEQACDLCFTLVYVSECCICGPRARCAHVVVQSLVISLRLAPLHRPLGLDSSFGLVLLVSFPNASCEYFTVHAIDIRLRPQACLPSTIPYSVLGCRPFKSLLHFTTPQSAHSARTPRLQPRLSPSPAPTHGSPHNVARTAASGLH